MKKDNNKLLKPDSAVASLLDTLLQESTEEAPVKPVKEPPQVILLPDLDNELETRTEIQTQNPEQQKSHQHNSDQVSVVETESEKQIAVQEVEKNELLSKESPAYETQYNFPLQCLMFSIEGNRLSIPLIALGSVLPGVDALTRLPGSPDWFLGLLQYRENKVKVVDSSILMNIKRKQATPKLQHLLVLEDEKWGITCDELGEVIYLEKEDIQWAPASSSTMMMGTLKDSLAHLLNPEKIQSFLREQQQFQ